MEKITYQIKPRTSKIELPSKLGFGKIFTDHIFEMDYSPDKGWHNYLIKPVENLSVHPAAMFIHYGQSIFEGLKAFHTVKGDTVIFRPETHLKRLNHSAKRLCMPQIDETFVLHALKELVAIEKDWIPTNSGESLYIRPLMFGTDEILGVHPSKVYKFIIMLSPVGAYYPEGFKPVKILMQDDYVRAVRKGVGDAKTAGNYAASLLATEIANQLGYTQVLWLDGVEQKYLEEVGTMNIFVEFENEIATPKLTGSILPGITRASVIQLLKDKNYTINERLISVDEFIEAYKNGKLKGVFGTGTAAIISPVSEVTFKGNKMVINNGEGSKLAVELFNEITEIQRGGIADKHDWITNVATEVTV
ncbi:MAG: branched chain amino acid aminotransferase [Ignavibacteria bacterium CG22_combo_CG10-13_8_21_14_all_37_15]|nr:MAG: branched chain amino acid aminotransferase [Ignavibacteria bacterium CG22_combo_CG10-13_8_21_14_all_37_15]PJC58381.1 MAG: branched chain amino acid aminotransferase [Ignavibacteria bacterium CG_4_9_14_0_2_um_filter_37_13]